MTEFETMESAVLRTAEGTRGALLALLDIVECDDKTAVGESLLCPYPSIETLLEREFKLEAELEEHEPEATIGGTLSCNSVETDWAETSAEGAVNSGADTMSEAVLGADEFEFAVEVLFPCSSLSFEMVLMQY